MYIHTYIHTFMHTYIYTYIHTYVHHRFRSLYECDELPGFTTKCIDMFEMLPPQQVAETLQTFIQK